MNDIKERVIAVIGRVLRLNPQEQAVLHQETGHERLNSWTSARHAEIIFALEDEFEMEIEGSEIPHLDDVAKIVSYFQSKQPRTLEGVSDRRL